MNEEHLKVILTVLSSIIFSMLFILIALVIPLKESSKYQFEEKPESKLGEISKAFRER